MDPVDACARHQAMEGAPAVLSQTVRLYLALPGDLRLSSWTRRRSACACSVRGCRTGWLWAMRHTHSTTSTGIFMGVGSVAAATQSLGQCGRAPSLLC